MNSVFEQDIKIPCTDGIELTGTLFNPSENYKAAIFIGPATGIRRNFYRPFASYLASQGFGVITFDNRGIGDSLVGSVKRCSASLLDWGQLDMPAVLDVLKLRFPGVACHLIGHSAGGQLVGLMPNAKNITSMFNIASSSGSLRNMRLPYRLKARFFMNVFIPFSNFFYGYTKSHWVGMGEPLPKNVAKQWSTWCNGQGYVKTAFGKSVTNHTYHELNFPSLWIYATDDDIAIEKNVDDMIAVFAKLHVTKKCLHPKDYGCEEIGHMKFFSRKNQRLWQIALSWFEHLKKEE